MKKVLMTLFVMFAVVTAYAQEMYVGGGIGLWRNHDLEVTSFSISPDFGYGLNEKWSVGGQLILDVAGGNGTTSATSFAIAPYARFSYYENKVVRLFLDMGVGLSVYKQKHSDSEAGFELGVKPGLAVKLNNHFSFITKDKSIILPAPFLMLIFTLLLFFLSFILGKDFFFSTAI